MASRLGLGLPKDQQPTEFQVKVKMMEDANFTPEQILNRIAPPDKPSVFREKFDMLTATGDYSPKDALNLLVGDNSTARDQRIQDIMIATNRTRDQVVLDLENQLRTDPVSGVTSLYEPFTRNFTPVIVDWANIEGADASRVTVPPLSAENIQPLLREGEGVGIKSALANTFNSVIGQFIPVIEFDSEREARERIGAINVAVNEAFTGGGRSPVITLAKLQELFPEPNEAWLNPKDAALKFQTSASYLAQVYADDLRGSKDPQLGQKEMQDLGARAQGMLNALQLIVTPETLKQIESVAESGLRVEDNYKKLEIEQILAIDPSNMVPLERAAYTARLQELKSLATTEEK